jgi:hypothetical protein
MCTSDTISSAPQSQILPPQDWTELRHCLALYKQLGLKPTIDNGFGGKEYEIDKKRIRPPRAPVRLSPEARAKLAERLRQIRDFTSQNTRLQVKSEAKKQNKGK